MKILVLIHLKAIPIFFFKHVHSQLYLTTSIPQGFYLKMVLWQTCFNLDLGLKNDASLARKRRKNIISQKKGSTSESSRRPRITPGKRAASRTKTNTTTPGIL